jgi:hypothetical protein
MCFKILKFSNRPSCQSISRAFYFSAVLRGAMIKTNGSVVRRLHLRCVVIRLRQIVCSQKIYGGVVIRLLQIMCSHKTTALKIMCSQKTTGPKTTPNYVQSENYCKLCVVRKLLQIMCSQKTMAPKTTANYVV